jgi:hypothetical protein
MRLSPADSDLNENAACAHLRLGGGGVRSEPASDTPVLELFSQRGVEQFGSSPGS